MLECIEGCFHTRVFDKVRQRYFHKKMLQTVYSYPINMPYQGSKEELVASCPKGSNWSSRLFQRARSVRFSMSSAGNVPVTHTGQLDDLDRVPPTFENVPENLIYR